VLQPTLFSAQPEQNAPLPIGRFLIGPGLHAYICVAKCIRTCQRLLPHFFIAYL